MNYTLNTNRTKSIIKSKENQQNIVDLLITENKKLSTNQIFETLKINKNVIADNIQSINIKGEYKIKKELIDKKYYYWIENVNR